jgi:hypothetical protein
MMLDEEIEGEGREDYCGNRCRFGGEQIKYRRKLNLVLPYLYGGEFTA